jgi:hypothetical protein
MFTLTPQYLSRPHSGGAEFIGQILVKTTCDAAEPALAEVVSVDFDCFDSLQSGPGTGTVRIEARSKQAAVNAVRTFAAVSRRVNPATRIAGVTPALRGRPTWARTAPLTGTLLAGEAALLLPAARFRRRRATSGPLPGLEAA